jgi:hypothetical protein
MPVVVKSKKKNSNSAHIYNVMDFSYLKGI